MRTRRTGRLCAIALWLWAAPQALDAQSAPRASGAPAPKPNTVPPKRAPAPAPSPAPAPAPPPAPAPAPSPAPAPPPAKPAPPTPAAARTAQQAEDEAIMRDLEFYMLLEMLKHYPLFYDDPEPRPPAR